MVTHFELNEPLEEGSLSDTNSNRKKYENVLGLETWHELVSDFIISHRSDGFKYGLKACSFCDSIGWGFSDAVRIR